MHSIFEFGAKKVREVMVPRIDVIALDIHTPLDEVRAGVTRAGHSRMPVYDGSIDRIVGILYVKDLLPHIRQKDQFNWQKLIREPFFVPETKKINDLLKEFQEKMICSANSRRRRSTWPSSWMNTGERPVS